MTDKPTPEPEGTPASPPAPGVPAKKEEGILTFLLKVGVLVLLFRSFVFSPFSIPSESMLPRLLDGDYLIAAKWPYGFSRYSFPFSLPLIPGRILASQPKRGDVVIFKAPADMSQQMKGGVLFLNGSAIPKQRIADFEVTVSPNTHCYNVAFQFTRLDGTKVCRYPQYRETLPEGKTFHTLYFGEYRRRTPYFDPDNTDPYVVPQDSLFVMGDDRDNSADSRYQVSDGGVYFLPQANLVGRATVMMWSTDGSASWIKPWSWFSAARWSRIGGTF